jgi:hypothetical protein
MPTEYCICISVVAAPDGPRRVQFRWYGRPDNNVRIEAIYIPCFVICFPCSNITVSLYSGCKLHVDAPPKSFMRTPAVGWNFLWD